jgi:hypothetical protein
VDVIERAEGTGEAAAYATGITKETRMEALGRQAAVERGQIFAV